VIKTMAEQVAFQLRKRQQISKRVKLEIHYTDGLRSARYDSVANNNDKSLVEICYRLFDLANYRRNRVRTIIVDASRFVHFADQVSLFENTAIKNQKLSKALDIIRRRHGANSIHSASALGNIPKQNPAWIKKIDKVLDQNSPVWIS